jgi:RHS repeat-associated protein
VHLEDVYASQGWLECRCLNLSNNRYTLGGTTYDADGNLLNDTFHAYTWNVYGRPATIDGTTTLTYDANDVMIEKGVSGEYTELEYGPNGKNCTMNGTVQVQCITPLPGGSSIARGPETIWHPDWLGSVRLGSSPSNRTVTFDRAFAPFGESYNTITGGTTNLDFTGLTQDSVSGEYDTPNRLYHPGQGRWISPDPAGIGAVNLGHPQSWNRYAYVLNNPLALIDPSGLWCVWGDGTHDDNPNPGQDGTPITQDFNEQQCKDAGGYWDATSKVTGCDDNTGNCTGPVSPDDPGQYDVCGIQGDRVCFTPDEAPGATFNATGSAPGDWGTPIGPGWFAANNDSWAWTATKSFFRDFSVFGPKNDPRPSCFGTFLKDSGANFVGVPGVDTVAAAATAHYGISQSLAQAVPNTRVARGGISPRQWLAADEAARVSNAGKFSLLFNADVAMAQAFFQNELPAALAGECK